MFFRETGCVPRITWSLKCQIGRRTWNLGKEKTKSHQNTKITINPSTRQWSGLHLHVCLLIVSPSKHTQPTAPASTTSSQVSPLPFCGEGLPEAGQGHRGRSCKCPKLIPPLLFSLAAHLLWLTGNAPADCLRACESGFSTCWPRCHQRELRQSSQSDSDFAKKRRRGRRMNRRLQQEM